MQIRQQTWLDDYSMDISTTMKERVALFNSQGGVVVTPKIAIGFLKESQLYSAIALCVVRNQHFLYSDNKLN